VGLDWFGQSHTSLGLSLLVDWELVMLSKQERVEGYKRKTIESP